MVADCHQLLMKGGIFLYPISHKSNNGKLRFIYEVIPFSFIFECAGGKGLDLNYNSILNNFFNKKINIEKLHGRASIILASEYESNNIKNISHLYESMQC